PAPRSGRSVPVRARASRAFRREGRPGAAAGFLFPVRVLEMLAVLGVAVMAITVVLFALAMVEFRRPVPPKWVGFPLMEQLVVLSFTCAVAVSGGLILKFVFNFKKETFGTI